MHPTSMFQTKQKLHLYYLWYLCVFLKQRRKRFKSVPLIAIKFYKCFQNPFFSLFFKKQYILKCVDIEGSILQNKLAKTWNVYNLWIFVIEWHFKTWKLSIRVAAAINLKHLNQQRLKMKIFFTVIPSTKPNSNENIFGVLSMLLYVRYEAIKLQYEC